VPTGSATPKKASPPATKKTVAKKRPSAPRKRAVKKVAAAVSEITDVADDSRRGQRDVGSSGPRQIEQLALVALALLFGLVGLAVHVLWFVSIVMMAIQLGLIASEFGNRRGSKGIISEVTHEVAIVVEEIKSGPSDQDSSDATPAVAATSEGAPTT
jgi:Flp pilus assembly protein TadB